MKCISGNGHFASVEELKVSLVSANENKPREILRHEITFQRITHPSDANY